MEYEKNVFLKKKMKLSFNFQSYLVCCLKLVYITYMIKISSLFGHFLDKNVTAEYKFYNRWDGVQKKLLKETHCNVR